MRAIFAGSILVLAGGAQAQKVIFDAVQNGKPAGSLELERKVSGGTMTVSMVMNIKSERGSGRVQASTIYDSKGVPKSKHAVITGNGKTAKLSATFSGLTANVTASADGKTRTQKLTAPTKTPLTDPSVWWFITTKPTPRQTFKYQALNPLTMKWADSTTRYLGQGTVKVGNRTIKGHQIATTRSDGNKSITWLDDKGVPLMMDQGTLKFIRRS